MKRPTLLILLLATSACADVLTPRGGSTPADPAAPGDQELDPTLDPFGGGATMAKKAYDSLTMYTRFGPHDHPDYPDQHVAYIDTNLLRYDVDSLRPAGDRWRLISPEKLRNKFADKTNFVKGVYGTYTDVNGNERTTRANRHGGWTFAGSRYPDLIGTDDHPAGAAYEILYVICDEDFDGFPANRYPATDIRLHVRTTVQWGEHREDSVRRRPTNRRSHFDRETQAIADTALYGDPVVCPLPETE